MISGPQPPARKADPACGTVSSGLWGFPRAQKFGGGELVVIGTAIETLICTCHHISKPYGQMMWPHVLDWIGTADSVQHAWDWGLIQHVQLVLHAGLYLCVDPMLEHDPICQIYPQTDLLPLIQVQPRKA